MIRTSLAALAALALCPVAAGAQDVSAPALAPAVDSERGAHAALAATLSPPAARDAAFAVVMREFEDAMRGTPAMAALEVRCPGYIVAVRDIARPFLAAYHEQEGTALIAAMTDLFAARLTPADADAARVFYTGPLGVKMMTAMHRNLTFRQSMQGAIENSGNGQPAIDAKALEADQARGIAGAIGEFSAEEIAAIGTALQGQPWFDKLRALQPEMQAVQLRVANTPPPADLAAKMEAAIMQTAQRHAKSCGR